MKSKRNLVSYSIIILAIQGDMHAIGVILIHYENYIITLSQKTLFDEYGNSYISYEEEVKRSLETKLIVAISKFKF